MKRKLATRMLMTTLNGSLTVGERRRLNGHLWTVVDKKEIRGEWEYLLVRKGVERIEAAGE